MSKRFVLLSVLILMGAGWGLTLPLSKIAVSEGYRQFGLIFWQLVIAALILGGIVKTRGKGLPFGRAHMRMYLFVAFAGTIFPNAASFQAAVYLPAGILAIVISMVPIFAFPVALMMANEKFSWLRLVGLIFGFAGVLILIGPEASLPERAMIVFIPLAMVAPLFYAIEGNVVAKFGTAGLDPIQLLCGASIVGTVIVFPLAVFSGQWISPLGAYTAPDYALIASSVIHALVYTAYVWMVGQAGAVFAAQVSYLVTGFGVVWAMLLLAERYSGWVWLALAVMFIGLFLVQPRKSLVRARDAGQDEINAS